jgi:hypothetical protein
VNWKNLIIIILPSFRGYVKQKYNKKEICPYLKFGTSQGKTVSAFSEDLQEIFLKRQLL